MMIFCIFANIYKQFFASKIDTFDINYLKNFQTIKIETISFLKLVYIIFI